MPAKLVSARLELVRSAEQSLVGILMDRPQLIPAAVAICRPERVEDTACRLIYQAILDELESSGDVNALTVAERLENAGSLVTVGGFPFLVGLAANAPAGAVEPYARQVEKNGRKAALARAGQRLIDAANRPAVDPSEIARAAVGYLRPISEDGSQEPRLLLPVSELYEAHQAQRWAVKSIIPENAVGMFFGASGTFKSFVALDYALHRCYGMPWIGRKTKKGIPVYIAAEGGSGLIRRIEAWHRMRGMDWRNCPMRVVVVPIEIQSRAAELRDAIDAAKVQPSDIIVDTMSQTYGGEENSSTEVAAYLRTIGAELRAPFGATVLVVHHTGHQATERPRGSSAIIANTDFLFGVYRDEKELLATVECVKQKDGERWGAVSFGLHHVSLGQDEDGDEVSSLAARHISGASEILEAAKSSGESGSALVRLLQAIGSGAPEEEVRKRFYISMPESDADARRQAYYRALKRAEGQRLVTRNGDWIEVVATQQNGEMA